MIPKISLSDLSHDGPAINITDEMCAQLGAAYAKMMDDHIRTRLNQVLGRDDWKPEDLAGRLEIRMSPDKTEWFYLDDDPFMKAQPNETEFDGRVMRVSRPLWSVRHPLEDAT